MPEIKAEASQAGEFGGETLEPGLSQREILAVALGEGWLKLGAPVWPHFVRNSVSSACLNPAKGEAGFAETQLFSLHLGPLC